MTSLFSSPKAMPAAPIAPVAPTPNSDAITRAQQQQLEKAATQSGRASTILSMNDISKSDSLGGD